MIVAGCLAGLLSLPVHGGTNAAETLLETHLTVPKDRGEILGKILDAADENPAAFATVALMNLDSTVVSGVAADENGVFLLANVAPGNYLLRITLLGYTTLFVPNVTMPTEVTTTDLGIIRLSSTSQDLNEVVIRAEKTMIVSDIDKKIVNVGKDLLATSSNVSELLEKVPSVSLDENGTPMVRGKGSVVVLIDGKPSTLYGNDVATVLQSFPAELIERIEVMTTPSAKYEGEGASGVIDIITKKTNIRGTSGSVRASLGTFQNNNGSGYISYKTGKWALRASGSAQSRQWYFRRELNRENFPGDTSTFFTQNGTGKDRNTNLFGRLGVNYEFNEKNTLGLTLNYSEDKGLNQNGNFNETRSESGAQLEQFDRYTNGTSSGDNINMNLDYRKTFDKERQVFTFTANYSEGDSEGESEFDQTSDFPALVRRQRNLRNSDRKSLFLDTDYTWPITVNSTLEVGVRTRLNRRTSTNSFFLYDLETEVYEFDEDVSNEFGYSDAIHTGYMTFSQKSDAWGIRGGLRLTDATQNIDQSIRQPAFSAHFLMLVPSLAITRMLDEETQIKLNYSRRVQRPQADMLNPFTDISDPRNIREGNPNLTPEFTHKAEVGYSQYKQEGGWGPSLFLDYSNNSITRIRTIDDAGISYSRFDNVGRELSYGFETDVSKKVGEKLKLNASGRVFRSEVVSVAANINNQIWSYSGNLNAFLELPLALRASAYLTYDGPRAIAQGTRQGVFVANMGLRKDFFERKGTLSFNVQDLLLSRMYKSEVSTDSFVQNSLWQRTNRYLGVTFHYRFGKISGSGGEGSDA
ncbi:TonB-dependent receptor [Arundinibacter roseus]|uniref:TonB-dependent receptor n=2 Tax=Arundinibacter roseus TaxID=2070510 RepID=A0A4R4JYV0_9BACT|nr:TonB-dependent receptor [Arundinibacter roseus]